MPYDVLDNLSIKRVYMYENFMLDFVEWAACGTPSCCVTVAKPYFRFLAFEYRQILEIDNL
jgi:hypothetical protein